MGVTVRAGWLPVFILISEGSDGLGSVPRILVVLCADDSAGNGEFIRGPFESCLGSLEVLLVHPRAEERLVQLKPGCGTDRFAVGSCHTLLESVCLGDVETLMLPEDLMGEWHYLEEKVLSSQGLEGSVGCDTGGFESVVAYLACLAVAELDCVGEAPVGVAHGKFNDLAAGDAAHVLTAGE